MTRRAQSVFALAWIFLAAATAVAQGQNQSHPPMRPLPTPRQRELAAGPKKFVDSRRGNDMADGTEAAPWRTLAHATRQLRPGDTLYLRGGAYYERIALTRSGTAEQPITIASYPGELA